MRRPNPSLLGLVLTCCLVGSCGRTSGTFEAGVDAESESGPPAELADVACSDGEAATTTPVGTDSGPIGMPPPPETLAGDALIARIDEAEAQWEATRPPCYSAAISISGWMDGAGCRSGWFEVIVEIDEVIEARSPDCEPDPDAVPTVADVFDFAREDHGDAAVELYLDPTYEFIQSFTLLDSIDGRQVSVGVSQFTHPPKPTVEQLMAQLADARQRWSDADLPGYQATVESFSAWFWLDQEVTVIDNEITDFTSGDLPNRPIHKPPVGSGSEPDPDPPPTIEELFDRIESTIPTEQLWVTYDAELGYPTNLTSTPLGVVFDAFWGYTVTGLTPLP